MQQMVVRPACSGMEKKESCSQLCIIVSPPSYKVANAEVLRVAAVKHFYGLRKLRALNDWHIIIDIFENIGKHPFCAVRQSCVVDNELSAVAAFEDAFESSCHVDLAFRVP
jgi:hypothetical protein